MTKESPMIGIAGWLAKESRIEDAQKILKTVNKSKKSTEEDKKIAEKMTKELKLKNREKVAREVIKIIVNKKTSDLTPHPEVEKAMTIRAEDYSRIKDDIDERGIQVPLVIDDKNKVICGITRYKACVELGIEEVPVFEGKFDLYHDLLSYAILDNTMRRQLSIDERVGLTSSLLREQDAVVQGRPPKVEMGGTKRAVEAVEKKAIKALTTPIVKEKEKIEKKQRSVDKTVEKEYKLVIGKDNNKDEMFSTTVSVEVKQQIELLKAAAKEIKIFIRYEVLV